jgi:hypothetical protein
LTSACCVIAVPALEDSMPQACAGTGLLHISQKR